MRIGNIPPTIASLRKYLQFFHDIFSHRKPHGNFLIKHAHVGISKSHRCEPKFDHQLYEGTQHTGNTYAQYTAGKGINAETVLLQNVNYHDWFRQISVTYVFILFHLQLPYLSRYISGN